MNDTYVGGGKPGRTLSYLTLLAGGEESERVDNGDLELGPKERETKTFTFFTRFYRTDAITCFAES